MGKYLGSNSSTHSQSFDISATNKENGIIIMLSEWLFDQNKRQMLRHILIFSKNEGLAGAQTDDHGNLCQWRHAHPFY